MHAGSGAFEVLPQVPWTAPDGTPWWLLRDQAEDLLSTVDERLGGAHDRVELALLATQLGELTDALTDLSRAELTVHGLVEYGRASERAARQRAARQRGRSRPSLWSVRRPGPEG